MRCYQCGISIGKDIHGYSVEGREEAFCCPGCYLVYKITGTRGEEGIGEALLGRFGIGLLLSMNVMLLSFPLYGGIYASISLPPEFSNPIRFILMVLSIPVVVILGYPLLLSAFESVTRGRIGTDALILVGTLSAFIVSVHSTVTGRGEVYFETATMVLTLYTLGRYIETRARIRANQSLKGITSTMPSFVRVVSEDGVEAIPLKEVGRGDRVLVRAGEVIPVDGRVVEGEGTVDESFLTGEGMPVMKRPESEVYGGSINHDGALVVEVDKERKDFLYTRIERLIHRLGDTPSDIKRIGDRIASVFVPVVVLISVTSFLYWVSRGEFTTGIMRMLAILLISCPCAFGMAAPLSVWRGIGEVGKRGIIVKGCDILEALSKVRTFFFDKTGTITTGRLSINGILPVDSISEDRLLYISASLASLSTHPVSRAIMEEAEKRGIELARIEGFRSYPGRGIEGSIDGKRYHLGSRVWIESLGIDVDKGNLSHKGDEVVHTSVFIADESSVIGLIGLKERLRHSAWYVFDELKGMGIRRYIITGDDEHGIKGFVDTLQPDGIKYRLLPEDKVMEIERAKRDGMVAMVGDGINDAPALAASTIGIALGCGAELTRESADINVIGEDLRLIPYLMRVSKRVRKNVYTNFFWASIYNIIGIYLAIIGSITPLFAVLAMILSSLFVISNSMRF